MFREADTRIEAISPKATTARLLGTVTSQRICTSDARIRLAVSTSQPLRAPATRANSLFLCVNRPLFVSVLVALGPQTVELICIDVGLPRALLVYFFRTPWCEMLEGLGGKVPRAEHVAL